MEIRAFDLSRWPFSGSLASHLSRGRANEFWPTASKLLQAVSGSHRAYITEF